jgi:hypothetical protein
MFNTILISTWCLLGFAFGLFGFDREKIRVRHVVGSLVFSPVLGSVAMLFLVIWLGNQLTKGEGWLSRKFPQRPR